jgi:hypothetical protein
VDEWKDGKPSFCEAVKAARLHCGLRVLSSAGTKLRISYACGERDAARLNKFIDGLRRGGYKR